MKPFVAFALVLSFPILFCSVGVSRTINVPGDFGTMEQAVDAARDDDVVLVAPGKYQEDIEIKRGVELQGSGAEVTTLIGSIVIDGADGVRLDGFTLQGQGREAHFGIWCSSSTLSVSNNTIVGYHHGIGSELSRMIIENNSVLRNFNVGIQIEAAIDVLIKGNSIVDNVDTGIRVSLSEDNVLLTGNFVTGNRVGIECVQSSVEVRKNVIAGNQTGVQSVGENLPDLGTESEPGLNAIEDNGFQVANMDRRHTLSAKYNYWGDSAGPDASGFEGKIDYTPWLDVAPMVYPVDSQGRSAISWGEIKYQGITDR